MIPERSGVRGRLAQRCGLNLHANSSHFTILFLLKVVQEQTHQIYTVLMFSKSWEVMVQNVIFAGT